MFDRNVVFRRFVGREPNLDALARSERSGVRARLGTVATALIAAGCVASPTEIVVVVDSDLAIPNDLNRVRVSVTGPSGEQRVSEGALASAADLPATVGLVHRGGPLGDASVLVEGVRGTDTVVARRASFAWEPNQTLALRLDLLRSCLSIVCGPMETCGENGCRPIAVAPEELEPYPPPPRRDASVPDAAVSDDAGPSDASFDAGPLDASVSPDGSIEQDGGLPACAAVPARCEVVPNACVCDSCACNPQCAADCEFACTRGSQCRIEGEGTTRVAGRCNASTCEIAARGTQNAMIACLNGAECTVDCRQAAECGVVCRDTSSCVVHCSGAARCVMADCTPTRCPGNILVCNAACP